jgi:hypothetical protein
MSLPSSSTTANIRSVTFSILNVLLKLSAEYYNISLKRPAVIARTLSLVLLFLTAILLILLVLD